MERDPRHESLAQIAMGVWLLIAVTAASLIGFMVFLAYILF
jgi:hypothetical protein